MLIPEGGQAHRVAVWQLLEMRLKIWGSHFRFKSPNLNVRRGIKSVPSLALPSCKSLKSIKRNFEKKNPENLDFVENSSHIRGSIQAGFRGFSVVNSQIKILWRSIILVNLQDVCLWLYYKWTLPQLFISKSFQKTIFTGRL